MVKLFNKLIEVRDISHQMHSIPNDSEEHEALHVFYTEIVTIFDELSDVYSAQYGIIEDFGEFGEVNFDDKISYFEEFISDLKKYKSDLTSDNSHLEYFFNKLIISTYKLIFKLDE